MERDKNKSGMRAFFNRLFCKRNIVVLSDHKVGHYALTGKTQAIVFGATLLVVSTTSFFAGNYFQAQSDLVKTEEALMRSMVENKKMVQDFSVLRKDLSKTVEMEKGLSDYSQFILSQYENEKNAEPNGFDLSNNYASMQLLTQRLMFLEEHIDTLRVHNAQQQTILDAIRSKTDGKISELERLIAMTKMKPDALEAEMQKLQQEIAKVAPEEPLDGITSTATLLDGKGGPYLPLASLVTGDLSKSKEEKILLSDVDRLVILQSIIEKLPLAKPVLEARLTSHFGRRKDPFTGRWARHSGMDFAGKYNADILSTAPGKVIFVGRKGAYGKTIDIDHGMGIVTRYGHLKKIFVNRGEQVKKGQRIGMQGNTGRSTGQHLHYEVRYKGKAINPKYFLKAGEQYVSQ